MIQAVDLRKDYGNVVPIARMNFTVSKGDVISVIGPSGTGKSTLLRMINMLERPSSGKILVDGEDITAPGYPLDKLRQKIGMVFQSFNLFNNMTVIENVCFSPISVKGIKPSEAYKKGMELLETVGLASFALSYPQNLSGGQKQRVAIARSLAMEPECILFDEPTSALDPTMVGEVEAVIKRLATQGYTMMLVTHDMSFARKVANRVFFLSDGKLYEEGTPEQIFDAPQKEKTRAFILRLRDLNVVIDDPLYDYISLYTAVDEFAFKNDVEKKLAGRLTAVLEELCFGMIMPEYKKAYVPGSSVAVNISYSDINESCVLTATVSNADLDLNRDEYEISRRLIGHYAQSVDMTGQGKIVIVI